MPLFLFEISLLLLRYPPFKGGQGCDIKVYTISEAMSTTVVAVMEGAIAPSSLAGVQ